MQQLDKLKTYIGFSIKMNKILYGYDSIISCNKRIHLIIYGDSTNIKIQEKLKLYCENRNIKLIKLDNSIAELVNKENCKIIGLLDKNLSDVIISLN